MPPLTVVWFEAVGSHCLLEYHAVVVLLLSYRGVGSDGLSWQHVRMGRYAEVVVGAAHVHLFLQLHVEECEVDGASAGVSCYSD